MSDESEMNWWYIRLTGNTQSLAPGTPVDIEEPPCKNCFFWRPVVSEWLDGEHYNGMTLCHAGHQEFDFSCYRERANG